MHDTVDLEARGIPAGFVATTEFEDAAAAQAAALGADPARVFIPHPIQDRSEDEIRELARDAAEAVIGLVCVADP